MKKITVTSMLVTDVGDEMCWWQLVDVDDRFGHFGHRHPLSFHINVRHQHSKHVTRTEILSSTSENFRQLLVTNITLPKYHFSVLNLQRQASRFRDWCQLWNVDDIFPFFTHIFLSPTKTPHCPLRYSINYKVRQSYWK